MRIQITGRWYSQIGLRARALSFPQKRLSTLVFWNWFVMESAARTIRAFRIHFAWSMLCLRLIRHMDPAGVAITTMALGNEKMAQAIPVGELGVHGRC